MKSSRLKELALAAALFAGALGTSSAQAQPTNALALQTLQQIKTVFVIALENHDWTQPNPTGSPQQILGNPAAPYVNSLITPGNSNAVQVSYATKYYNVGQGRASVRTELHLVGSRDGVRGSHGQRSEHGFGQPVYRAASHRPVDRGGHSLENLIRKTWNTPRRRPSAASGTRPSGTNPYNGINEYDYAVKHNPMEFFTDTQNQNVYPLTQLLDGPDQQ